MSGRTGQDDIGARLLGDGAEERRSLARAARVCVLVLGMHRSGTSAATRILSIAGAKLPENLNAAGGGNDIGYWESKPLIDYNNKILAELDSTWSDWRKLDFSRVPVKRRSEIKVEIADIVTAEFGDAPLIVIKEPRICRFAPLFLDALEDAGFDCRCVLPIRSPLEVVQSLEQRDQMLRGRACLLWLRHVLDTELASRNHLRAFVSFDRLMDDWRGAFGHISAQLHIEWPYAANEIAVQIESFLSPKERHHTATTEQVLLDPMMRGWTADVYSALLVLERNPASSPALAVLDRVRQEFGGAGPIIERLMAESERAEAARLSTLTDALREEKARLDGAQNEIEGLRASFGASSAASAIELRALEDKLTELGNAHEQSKAREARLQDEAQTLAGQVREAAESTREALAVAARDAAIARAERAGKLDALAQLAEARATIAGLRDAGLAAERLGSVLHQNLAAESVARAKVAAQLEAAHAASARLQDVLRAVEERNALLSEQLVVEGKEKAEVATQLDQARREIVELQAWADQAQAEMQRLRDEVAQREMHLHAMGTSTSWRITRPLRGLKRALTDRDFRQQLPYRLARGAARRLKVPILWRARAKALAARLGLIFTGSPIEVPVASAPRSPSLLAAYPRADGARYRTLWIVNDSDLQTQKYRVFNYLDELAARNISSTVMREAELCGFDPVGFDLVILNRIAASDQTRALVARSKKLGIPVRYDIDDLVFDPERLDLLRFTQDLNEDEYRLFRNGVAARRELMLACDAVTTSTAELAAEVARLGLPAFVTPNTIGRRDWDEFSGLSLKRPDHAGRVRIAYLSGTKTHQHDFACCAAALIRVLKNNSRAELLIVGELTLDEEFAEFHERIIRKPLMEHRDMLRELAEVDINLAPLELNNAFTACKSELKIFEAALLGVPSVASPTPTFAAIVQHGKTGMLAASAAEWETSVQTLVDDPKLRRRLGEAARREIAARFSIMTATDELMAVDQAMIAGRLPTRSASTPTLAPMSASAPLISVVAILYNKRNEVRYFLECLRRQDFTGPFEILLVDDCSPDDSAAVVEEFCHHQRAGNAGALNMMVRILRNDRNLGNCGCRNRALEEAGADVVIIVDADCMLDRSFLSEHYRAHTHGDCDAAIGPMNIETNGEFPFSVLGRFEADRALRFSAANLQDDVNRSHFVNCVTRNFSISKRFIREHLRSQLFDERFSYSRDPESGFGWEDVEMGCRLYKAGARIRFLDATFSIHVSHPSSAPEKTKPLRSLKNFRRLHEKHRDLVLLARQWSIHTYGAICDWVRGNGLSLGDNDDADYLAGVFGRYQRSSFAIKRTKPLRVLTHRWHCPHQYELYRSGHDFTLVTGAGTAMCDSWEWDKRPLPTNAHFKPWQEIDPRDYDLLLLHFDENILHPDRCGGKVPADWGATLKRLVAESGLPTIAVCHGTPQFFGQYDGAYKKPNLGQVDETSRLELVSFFRDALVICNSHQAEKEWGFANSRTVWHGFAPHDYPEGSRSGGALTMLRAALENRPHYNGLSVVDRVEALVGDRVRLSALRVPDPPLSYARNGQEWAEAKFRNYARAVGGHDIYLNPTLRSPMPRSRGEAMMLGLVSVSMRNHDVDLFIQNGVNGFYADSAEELAEQLMFLTQKPDVLARMAAASRRTALDLFNQDRYLARWSDIFAQYSS